MSRKTEIWIFPVFAILMVIFAFAPPLVYWNTCELFALDGGPCLAEFIDRFQTLIAGFAAVIGALFTVRTMQQTDSESERRHRQLTGLSLRADALLFDRYFENITPIIHRALDEVNKFLEQGSPQFTASGYPEYDIERIAGVELALCNIRRVFLNEAFKNVVLLLDGNATKLMLDAGMSAQTIENQLSAAQKEMLLANGYVERLPPAIAAEDPDHLKFIERQNEIVTIQNAKDRVISLMADAFQAIPNFSLAIDGFLLELNKMNDQYREFSHFR